MGLTGGIACGKSQVLRRLEASGCFTLDLDHVAREVMAPAGSAYADVVEAFGPAVLAPDGAIDRKALAGVVFQDPGARERLNAIVHPRVRIEEQRQTAAFASQADAVVVVDAALLVEAGMHLRFDRLVVVHCSPEQQLERLMERDGLSRDEAAARIRAQMPIAEKRRFGNFEVDTSGRPEDTDLQADGLAVRLRSLSRAPVRRIVVARPILAALLSQEDRTGEREIAIRILDDIASWGGLEMRRVAALLDGRHDDSWLASPDDHASLRPAALVAPVVVWCLTRRGNDEELLGLAAMSLARAVTVEAELIADTCATAFLIAQSVAGGETARAGSEERAAALARRWSGIEPPRVGGSSVTAPGNPDARAWAAADRFLSAARAWTAAG